jgi:hypothetical protein
MRKMSLIALSFAFAAYAHAQDQPQPPSQDQAQAQDMTDLLKDGFEIKGMAIDPLSGDSENMWILLQKSEVAAYCLATRVRNVKSFRDGAVCSLFSSALKK